MKYRSLSLTGFEAVQVDLEHFDPVKAHRWKREQPEWFQLMMDRGNISPTKSKNECHVILKNENATFFCYQGDYIVRNRSGLVFWMPKALFEESFAPDNGRFPNTHKQQAVLDYIVSCEMSPSIREIMNGMGYKSTAVVKRHLDCLKERGHIDFIAGKARSIVVL